MVWAVNFFDNMNQVLWVFIDIRQIKFANKIKNKIFFVSFSGLYMLEMKKKNCPSEMQSYMTLSVEVLFYLNIFFQSVSVFT